MTIRQKIRHGFDTARKWVGAHKRATAAAGAFLTVAYCSPVYIDAHEFGVRETMFNVTDTNMKPGIYFQVPLAQFTHQYQTNTQRIDFTAGSCRWVAVCNSTEDQNVLTASFRLAYKVRQNDPNIIYHRWEMRSWLFQSDGYFLLTGLLNDSTNAVMGRQSMAATMADPARFNREVYEDFKLRLQMNNVPVEIESLELKRINTTIWPTRTVSYQINGMPQGGQGSAPQPPR